MIFFMNTNIISQYKYHRIYIITSMANITASERQEIIKAIMDLGTPIEKLTSMLQDTETPLNKKNVRAYTARIEELCRVLGETCENVINA